MSNPPYKGRCLCGKVTFEINVKPIRYTPMSIRLLCPTYIEIKCNMLPLFKLQNIYRDCFHHQRCVSRRGRLEGICLPMVAVVKPRHWQSQRILTGQELVNVYIDQAQDSGNQLLRHFCSNCGSPLFNTNGDFGQTMAVFYSALVDFEHKPPEVEYYSKDRISWLPAFPGTLTAPTKPGRD